MTFFLSTASLVLLTLSCSESAKKLDFKDEEKMKVIREAATNENTKQDQKIYIQFTSSSLDTSGLTIASAFTYSSNDLIHISDRSGNSRAYNTKTKSLGSLTTHEDASDYDKIYDFPETAYLGLNSAQISFGMVEDGYILNQSWDDSDVSIMTVAPGFLAYYNSSNINLMFEDDEKIKNFRMELSDKDGNALFGTCVSGCLIWKMLEDKLVVGVADSGITTWHEYAISISGLEFSSIRSLHLIISYSDTIVNVSSGSGLTTGNKLIRLDSFTPASLSLTNEDQEALVELYCRSCHVLDEHNNQLSSSWWQSKDALASLTNEPGVNPMPPPDSYLGQSLSKADRLNLIKYFQSLDTDNKHP